MDSRHLSILSVTGKLTKNRPVPDIAVVGIITDISGSNCTILVYLRDDYAKIFDDIDNAITAIKGGYTEGTLKTRGQASTHWKVLTPWWERSQDGQRCC